MTQPVPHHEPRLDPPSDLDTETVVDWEEVAYEVGCIKFHQTLESEDDNASD